MSFQEKSAWAMLVIFTGVYGVYFADVLGDVSGAGAPVLREGYLLTMVGLLIGLSIVAHIVIAIVSGEDGDESDERDRVIEMRADARSGYVLAAGVLGVLALAMLDYESFWIAHALLGALVISEIVKIVLRLASYRLGV